MMAVGGPGCNTVLSVAGTAADYLLCPVHDGLRWVPGNIPGHGLTASFTKPQQLYVPIARGPQIGPAVEGWRIGQQDDWITQYAVSAMASIHPNVTTVILPEVKQVVPYVPSEQRREVLRHLLRGIDSDIGQIVSEIRREGSYSRTIFAVTSGEALSSFVDTVPRASLEEAIVAAGGQKVYISTGDLAAFGLREPLQAQPVAQALQAEKLSGVDAIYYKAPHGNNWTYQFQYLNPLVPPDFGAASDYLLWTMASPTSPDVVVAYKPRTATGRNGPGNLPQTAASGGFQWNSQHIPLILAGAGVASNVVSSYPARLVDLNVTLEDLLGYRTAHTDGNVLADAMLSPPAGSLPSQVRARAWLLPLVNALRERTSRALS
ncbi:MAG: hypothetical protein NVSMB52_04110 [Chloroflexota bacterium]